MEMTVKDKYKYSSNNFGKVNCVCSTCLYSSLDTLVTLSIIS